MRLSEVEAGKERKWSCEPGGWGEQRREGGKERGKDGDQVIWRKRVRGMDGGKQRRGGGRG